MAFQVVRSGGALCRRLRAVDLPRRGTMDNALAEPRRLAKFPGGDIALGGVGRARTRHVVLLQVGPLWHERMVSTGDPLVTLNKPRPLPYPNTVCPEIVDTRVVIPGSMVIRRTRSSCYMRLPA